MQNKQIRTSVEVEEQIKLPRVWLIILGLVGAGIITHILVAIFSSGGLVIWPFVFAVSVLLLINDASDQNAVGVTPFQAYAFFFGSLLVFFLFVMVVSKTINPWVVVAGVIGLAIYLVRDWKIRKEKEREIQRRRLAGLCVRCETAVTDGLEDICPNCFTPVNPERLDLFRLGKAITMKSQSDKTRQVLTGSKPTRSQTHMQNLQQQRAYRYKRGK